MKTTTPQNLAIQSKDTKRNQLRATAAAFSEPGTRLMAAQRSGIERANICRYVKILRDSGRIAVVKIGICAITKHRAEYLSTDKSLWPAVAVQAELFTPEPGEAEKEGV